MKRRGFLGGLAALAASTPQNVLEASGVKQTWSRASVAGASLGPASAQLPFGAGGASWAAAARARKLALNALAPWWFEKRRRRDAYHVERLEPHIACLVSVSPAMKINMQREFQYRTNFDREMDWLEICAAEEAAQQ